MKLIKIKQANFHNRDVGIDMAVSFITPSFIIKITNKNMILLDYSLIILKHFPIIQTSISYLYVRPSYDEIFFYDANDGECSFVNLKTGINNFLQLPDHLSYRLSDAYCWKNNSLIIADYNKNFYEINSIKNSFTPIPPEYVEQIDYCFYEWFKKLERFRPCHVRSDRLDGFKQNQDGTILTYFNISSNFTASSFIPENLSPISDFTPHDYDYKNNIFLFVAQKYLKIISLDGSEITLDILEEEEISRAYFLRDDSMRFVLFKEDYKLKTSYVDLYEII